MSGDVGVERRDGRLWVGFVRNTRSVSLDEDEGVILT